MADQLHGINRPSDATPDEQPTLILSQSDYGEPNDSSNIAGAQEEKSPDEARPAEDLANDDIESALTSFGRLKKFCTSSPSRKTASAVSALVIAALSGIAGTVAPHFLDSTSGFDRATQHIVYAPWIDGDTLSPSIHIVRDVKGTCWTQSAGTPRGDAYRCFDNKSQIYDPCFTNDSQKIAICPMPSPIDVTSIQLEKSLPESPAGHVASGSAVWLIDLADGDDCYRILAASYSPGGMPLTYACKNGNLYGELNRDGKTWTIWEQQNGSADLTLVSVAQVYT